MEVIKFQGIGSDDVDIEGAVQGVGTFFVDHLSAVFSISSEKENKVMEVRVNKKPYWNFSIGPHRAQFTKNPNWKFTRETVKSPLLTEVLQVQVPDDAIIERMRE